MGPFFGQGARNSVVTKSQPETVGFYFIILPTGMKYRDAGGSKQNENKLY